MDSEGLTDPIVPVYTAAALCISEPVVQLPNLGRELMKNEIGRRKLTKLVPTRPKAKQEQNSTVKVFPARTSEYY